ncbi:MAG: peptide chain release factor N(5)-glutamine methyltransferase [Synergistetes bacterium]|nr:peptide chain release factor N(5)-glutamine methyltransferase [Synergistota bacterium]MDW8192831.1 peptide chain release factor N(5)-glutamine methyltransferase [Synergistota bacterium]
MKIREALNWTEDALRRAGINSPRKESECLLTLFLRKNLADIILHLDEDLPNEKDYSIWVARRCCREPIQYILGEVVFLDFRFKIRKGVFIPRPETEILVEEVLRWVDEGLILDLGIGCGNILLSMLAINKRLKGVGVDISDIAINLAKENAKSLGVEDRVLFLNSDWGESLRGWFKFDAIVSNPPYIPYSEIWNLEPEVLLYEPIEALNGGEDGTLFYRRMFELAKDLLKRDGILAFELGKEEYLDILLFNGFSYLSIRNDYNGKKRVVILKKD